MCMNDKHELIKQISGELASKANFQDLKEITKDETCRKLIRGAIDSLQYSYTPYSGFKVGAALLASDFQIYTGCNIENASFTPTNCAERTAFFKAISEGNNKFLAIAVVGGKNGELEEYCPPCGVCRQVMMEFCDPKTFLVIVAKSEEEYQIYTLEEILPMGFGPNNL